MSIIKRDYSLSALLRFWIYAAFLISVLRVTDGFSKAVRERNSFKTPVFSNFFLKRFSALSIDSFSLMLITSMFSTIWAANIVRVIYFRKITLKSYEK